MIEKGVCSVLIVRNWFFEKTRKDGAQTLMVRLLAGATASHVMYDSFSSSSTSLLAPKRYFASASHVLLMKKNKRIKTVNKLKVGKACRGYLLRIRYPCLTLLYSFLSIDSNCMQAVFTFKKRPYGRRLTADATCTC